MFSGIEKGCIGKEWFKERKKSRGKHAILGGVFATMSNNEAFFLKVIEF